MHLSKQIVVSLLYRNSNTNIMETNQKKIELIYKAIDALMDLCEIEEINSYEIVHNENSTVMKLRSAIYQLENE